MRFKDLTPEQKEMAKKCKTPEELLKLAQSEGYELTDDRTWGRGSWSIFLSYFPLPIPSSLFLSILGCASQTTSTGSFIIFPHFLYCIMARFQHRKKCHKCMGQFFSVIII